mmetsp:Transcript_91675/g.238957  ORF Transcript_91675/g.238957 Transcript_91675/m.238957 type:complete len:352 (+) Transcript_91675:860-1915(+)
MLLEHASGNMFAKFSRIPVSGAFGSEDTSDASPAARACLPFSLSWTASHFFVLPTSAKKAFTPFSVLIALCTAAARASTALISSTLCTPSAEPANSSTILLHSPPSLKRASAVSLAARTSWTVSPTEPSRLPLPSAGNSLSTLPMTSSAWSLTVLTTSESLALVMRTAFSSFVFSKPRGAARPPPLPSLPFPAPALATPLASRASAASIALRVATSRLMLPASREISSNIVLRTLGSTGWSSGRACTVGAETGALRVSVSVACDWKRSIACCPLACNCCRRCTSSIPVAWRLVVASTDVRARWRRSRPANTGTHHSPSTNLHWWRRLLTASWNSNCNCISVAPGRMSPSRR